MRAKNHRQASAVYCHTGSNLCSSYLLVRELYLERGELDLLVDFGDLGLALNDSCICAMVSSEKTACLTIVYCLVVQRSGQGPQAQCNGEGVIGVLKIDLE